MDFWKYPEYLLTSRWPSRIANHEGTLKVHVRPENRWMAVLLPIFNSRCDLSTFYGVAPISLRIHDCASQESCRSRSRVEWRSLQTLLRNEIQVAMPVVSHFVLENFMNFVYLFQAGTAASRGGEDSSRGTAELTKGNSGDHHVGYSHPATPSTPAPAGTNLQNSAAGSYSSFCGITGSTGSSALAPAAPSAGGGPIAGPASYRDHNEQQSSGEWDLKKWNEERERDRETWINDPEWLRVESWIDEHPNFCLDYFLRLVANAFVFCFFPLISYLSLWRLIWWSVQVLQMRLSPEQERMVYLQLVFVLTHGLIE